jgi:hypothetical protein
MKGLFISLLFVLCFTSQPTAGDFDEFIKGILVGMSESGDFNKLVNCIKDGTQIFAKVKEACENISHMSNNDVTKGVKVLIEGLTELMVMLKPCMTGFSQLLKLEQSLGKADISKLVRKVLASPGAYFHLSMDVLEAFEDKKFQVAGKALGTIAKNLFLSYRQDTTQMSDFTKGILQGLNEKGDVSELMSCIKEDKTIFEELIKALDLIKNIVDKDCTEGAKILVATVTNYMTMLKACITKFEKLKKLVVSLSKANIPQMVRKMLSEPGAFFHLSIDGLEAFQAGNYVDAGKAVGTILNKLFP